MSSRRGCQTTSVFLHLPEMSSEPKTIQESCEPMNTCTVQHGGSFRARNMPFVYKIYIYFCWHMLDYAMKMSCAIYVYYPLSPERVHCQSHVSLSRGEHGLAEHLHLIKRWIFTPGSHVLVSLSTGLQCCECHVAFPRLWRL